jgi:hypothetical protein
MITRIAIENFKGIGDRVEIPIRPITLLFGPNSAGKSTVMHAFHYAREIFERHNLNADKTIAGGDFIDLGGFKNFVHNHDLRKTISLRFDIDLSDVDMPHYSRGDLHTSIYDVPLQQPLETAWVEVEVAWDDIHNRAFVKTYEVGINDDGIGQIDSEKGDAVIRFFNTIHPVFTPTAKPEGEEDDRSPLALILESAVDEATYLRILRLLLGKSSGLDGSPHGIGDSSEAADAKQKGPDYVFGIADQSDALPPCGRGMEILLSADSARPGPDPQSDRLGDQRVIIGVLNQVFVGMAEIVRDELRRFCYLGPLRETPPREYEPPRLPDPSRWATGLAAWDTLCTCDEALLHVVNVGLLEEEGLNTGYRLERKRFLMLETESPLYQDLVSYRAFEEIEDLSRELHTLPERTELTLITASGLPLAVQDVGEGIAQVLPVVVAVLRPGPGVVQIEQPELHLHPSQQAALGDIFIAGALGVDHKRLMIETHSEHLVLRLLRRIRETSKKSRLLIPVTPNDITVLYARSTDDQTSIMEINVDSDGEFVQPWPDDFFEQDFHERFA